jgi:tRNA1Val (adenine37-N6)-methyltransferase
VGNTHFQFKEFRINQERSAMKVGTDGVLLGAWAEISHARHILDVGTGTGLIALMCAQRNIEADVHAIEVDDSSAEQAKENVKASKFADRISIEKVALQEFSITGSFDAIICNPPFFVDGTRSPAPERKQARHTDSLSVNELLEHSARLVSKEGSLHLILPSDQEERLLTEGVRYGWYLKRLTLVHPNRVKPAKRILVSLTRSMSKELRDHLTIEGEERFDYSTEYQKLTAPFYLKMK